MTTKYGKGHEVPDYVLASRLDKLSETVRRRDPDWVSEFTMRIPAEVDRDADLVLSEAARRIRHLEEIKAEWQAEALEKEASKIMWGIQSAEHPQEYATHLRKAARQLRRQAEGGE